MNKTLRSRSTGLVDMDRRRSAVVVSNTRDHATADRSALPMQPSPRRFSVNLADNVARNVRRDSRRGTEITHQGDDTRFPSEPVNSSLDMSTKSTNISSNIVIEKAHISADNLRTSSG